MLPSAESNGSARTSLAIALGLALALTQPAAKAVAQDSIPWPRADRLTVVVSVSDVQVRGDTLHIRYRLASAPGSEQAGKLFAVRSGGVVLRVQAPLGWYASHGVLSDSAAVDWSSLVRQAQLAPGDSLDGFEFDAVGVLGIVGFLAQGRYQVPVVTDATEGLLMAPPSTWADAFRGQTIGVVAPPADLSPSGLLSRLWVLTASTCHLQWIRDRDVCRELSEKLQEAARDLAGGHSGAAAEDLREFVTELGEAPRGHDEKDRERRSGGPEPIDDGAYWLLKVNAEYILARL